ncbi:hypothetical protein LB526_08070 [Mesorhizobium sp. CA6]|uniref:hypothetical protein n=1 Tax=Mesorhizobium sp. CA6 TaxID=588500 RepID=UPI001CCE9C9E|nr:hypothetical protein [Mesorhizobium sp. CA6]MBZ9766713.1 hypothetical protein [Mesorhizobium sp. CA6]
MPIDCRLNRMMRALCGLPRGALQEAIEPIRMWIANSGLRAEKFSDPDIAELSDADLSSYLVADGVRAKELDEKLQKLTAALSVAVTVGGLVGQTMLGGLSASWLKTATAFSFLIAELYLVVGVIVGFDGLRPRARYGYGPAFLRIMSQGGDAKRNELIAAANASERDNIMRANQASAAASAVRNGVLIFVFSVFLGILAVEFAPPPALSNLSSASK